MPSGRGEVNDKGFGFYDRLVDGAEEAGVRPLIALDHWELPQAREETREAGRAGPPSRPLPAIIQGGRGAFRDRAALWVTRGRARGVTAPWLRHGARACTHPGDVRRPTPWSRLALPVAVPRPELSRCSGGWHREQRLGSPSTWNIPGAATDRDDDHEAARRADGDAEPLVPQTRSSGGQYPPDVLQEMGAPHAGGARGRPCGGIAAPIDFLGAND